MNMCAHNRGALMMRQAVCELQNSVSTGGANWDLESNFAGSGPPAGSVDRPQPNGE